MTNVLLLLLLCSTVLGGLATDEPPEVFAFTGLPVVLPCAQTLPQDSEVPTIEWSKLNLSPPYVYVYRQNFEVYADKHRDFEFRTHLFMTKLHHGNFSMRLSNVRLEDAGTYLCKTIWNKNNQDVKRVKLIVVDLPDPHLSAVGSDDGAVQASCVVRSCSPVMPRVMLYDGDGRVSVTEKMEAGQKNSSGCYRVEQSIIAKASAKSVVCRVEFPEAGQSKEVHMLIPELAKESCVLPIIYAAAGTGAPLLVLIVGLVFLLHKRQSKLGDKFTLVHQSTSESSETSENNSLLRPQDSCLIVIPVDKVPEHQSTLTEAPDLISSTTSSMNSIQDSRNLIDLFDSQDGSTNTPSDDIDANAATCEINNDSIKFKNQQGKKTKLTRQNANATDLVLAKQTPPNVTQTQTNGISKPLKPKYPLVRSKSASESGFTPGSLDALKNYRRYSYTALSRLSEEEAELESLNLDQTANQRKN